MVFQMSQRTQGWFVIAMLLALFTLVLTISCGSSACLSPYDFNQALWMLRAPRVFSGFAVGGLLALAGALMQLLLRNPLADPYVLGVSGGAATGAMIFSFLLPATLSFYGLQFGALLGAMLAICLLFGLAHRSLLSLDTTVMNGLSGTRLILTGVMISAGCGAFITLLLSLAPDAQLRGTLFWLMGDLDTGDFAVTAWLVLLLVSFWAIRHAHALNVLAHGEATAQLLGVPVRRLRTTALLLASLATAAAVATAGAIGFIGLVVPHALRLLIGNDQRLLLPVSVLAGGITLTLADLAARTLAAPLQLPIGVITALTGVPVFLYMLSRSR